VVLEHYEEGHHNRFFQFAHDRATLKNEDKYQSMGMQFADKEHKHNNAIALSFRKLESHTSDKVAELGQEVINKTFGVEFADVFLCSVQDLAASVVAKESQFDNIECDVRQGDKVDASAVGELVRTANEVNLLIICIVVVMECFNFHLMHFLKSSSGSD